MKKRLCCLLMVLMIFSLTACKERVAVSNDDGKQQEVSEPASKPAEKPESKPIEAPIEEKDDDEKVDAELNADKITGTDPAVAFRTLCERGLEAAKNNDADAMAKLILNPNDDKAKKYIADLNIINEKNYPDFQYFVFCGNNDCFGGEIYNTITTGVYPDTKYKKSSMNFVFSYVDGEWLFDDSQASVEAVNKMIIDLYPPELMDAADNGRNAVIFENNDYSFVDSSIIYPGTMDTRIAAAWQNADGSVELMVTIKNGTNELRQVESLQFTLTDENLGTIINTKASYSDMLDPEKGVVARYKIPAEDVLTKTATWGRVQTHTSQRSR